MLLIKIEDLCYIKLISKDSQELEVRRFPYEHDIIRTRSRIGIVYAKDVIVNIQVETEGGYPKIVPSIMKSTEHKFDEDYINKVVQDAKYRYHILSRDNKFVNQSNQVGWMKAVADDRVDDQLMCSER